MTTERSTDISSLLEFKKLLQSKLECNASGHAKNFFRWREDIEFLLANINLTETAKKRAIGMALADQPQEWLNSYLEGLRESNPATEPSVVDILDALQDQFHNELWKNDTIQELFNSSTDLDGLEAYSSTFHRGRHLINTITKEQVLVHIFAKGLPPSVRNQVLHDAPDTLADAIGAAFHKRAEWQSMHPKVVPSRQAETTGRVTKPNDRRITCKFCGKLGHHEAVCRSKSPSNRAGPPASFFEAYPDHQPKVSSDQ